MVEARPASGFVFGPFLRPRVLDRSRSVGVVGGESVQVPQLTQAALDVRYVDLYVVLETTERERERSQNKI